MKFEIGDKTDQDLCYAITHEYLRCDDAFKLFVKYSEIMILQGKNLEISYRAYNAYASFIHHLYEFILGCQARRNKNTEITNKKGLEKLKVIESFITSHAQRVMDGYRDSIKRGDAPSWVNDISYYDVIVPAEFASDFRKYRNKISGHVSYERTSKLNLSEFYQKYHKFLYYLYRDSQYMWGVHNEFPDLKEITDFSVAIKS